MKIPVLVAVLLGLAGIGVLIAMNATGGATNSGFTIDRILKGEAGQKRIKLAVQVVEFHHQFKPVIFDAIDIVPEGQKPSLDAPRVRVNYGGDDKITLEPYSHVAIEGTWDEGAKTFNATSMVTRCPSHYEKKGPPPVPTGAIKNIQ